MDNILMAFLCPPLCTSKILQEKNLNQIDFLFYISVFLVSMFEYMYMYLPFCSRQCKMFEITINCFNVLLQFFSQFKHLQTSFSFGVCPRDPELEDPGGVDLELVISLSISFPELGSIICKTFFSRLIGSICCV